MKSMKSMKPLFRQYWALARKDLWLTLNRGQIFYTSLRAFIAPVIFAVFMSFVFQSFWLSGMFGIGTASPVRTLARAMGDASNDRNTLVFVNSVPEADDVNRVIQLVTDQALDGKTVKILSNENDLLNICSSSLRGVTECFGAAVFHASPSQGNFWNYTIRTDSALGENLNVEESDNDAEIYTIPLQHAIDSAIISVDANGALFSELEEYPFTPKTQEEWDESVTLDVLKLFIDYLAVVWYIAFVGLPYHLVGIVSRERECGMANLIDSMMPNVKRWETRSARATGHNIAFSILYSPSWLVMSFIIKYGLFPNTSVGILIEFFFLTGFSTVAFSLLCAVFFKKSLLSGIMTVTFFLVLGVIAQSVSKNLSTAAVAVLGFLFSPMTFVFFFQFTAKFEVENMGASIGSNPPDSNWNIPGYVFWIAFIFQSIAYPIVADRVERYLYGTDSVGRTVSYDKGEDQYPIQLTGFTKIYRPNWFKRRFGPIFGHMSDTVIAVNNITFSALKGQIMVMVGPNGCGKSTTLDVIAGINDATSGSIYIDGTRGIGICPQKNVLWDTLTVRHHAMLFNTLKSPEAIGKSSDVDSLIHVCGLSHKADAISKTLSGGQKRKLQLLMMLIGGSRVCCIDEVSGGLDPLSRRKIWDILLAERGSRTILLTTHFLDEAEFLADSIKIMARGTLRAEGSVSELKNRLGGGYRVKVYHGEGYGNAPMLTSLHNDISTVVMNDQTVYTAPNSARSFELIKMLQEKNAGHYEITGPTIEEVFMRMTDDSERDDVGSSSQSSEKPNQIGRQHEEASGNSLLSGKHIGFIKQSIILFQKRLTIFRRSWLPLASATLLPIIATLLLIVLLQDQDVPGCDPIDQVSISDFEELSSTMDPSLVVGPSEAFQSVNLDMIEAVLPSEQFTSAGNTSSFLDFVTVVDTIDDFNDFIASNFRNVTPGGIFLGDETTLPTIAWETTQGLSGILNSIFLQNLLDVILSNTTIITSYRVFDFPFPQTTGDSLQFLLYFGLVMCTYPALFALYPTAERLRHIRSLEYSNGVRSLPLWLAYLIFDGTIVLVVSAVSIIILASAVSSAWWNIGYLFAVLLFYGIASVLLSYVISLFSKSPLSAFAFSSGGQSFMLLMYINARMTIATQVPSAEVDSAILIAHYTIALVSPVGNLLRALFVGLNILSTLCSGFPSEISTNPGGINYYGGPILYLILQSVLLFGVLLWFDSDFSIFGFWNSKNSPIDMENNVTMEKEVSDEISRVEKESDDGLQALHLSKTFDSRKHGSVVAVDDVSFGVQESEVFAVVGPNGAGKTTTIAMLRGDLKPSNSNAKIWINGISILQDRKRARQHLGVCPQFDALEQMTSFEHLTFYARIRGVEDAEYNAQQIIKAVGLENFANRIANKLSGGNKRKLSLGIALIGNPQVVLLDEPSSGMDPLAKRKMWQTLSQFVPNRSILLTTHSMEEAEHLSRRCGVVAKRMLDIGTIKHLRQKHGYGFHVHLVCKSAPRTTTDQMQHIERFIMDHFPGAEPECRHWQGQMRYSIPSQPHLRQQQNNGDEANSKKADSQRNEPVNASDGRSIGSIFLLLEHYKDVLGLEFYSVAPTTFDEVFLKVVAKHDVGEEEMSSKDTFLTRLKMIIMHYKSR